MASVDTTSELTGHPEVDAVVRGLDGLAELPVEEHVTVFEDAHVRLRDALSGS